MRSAIPWAPADCPSANDRSLPGTGRARRVDPRCLFRHIWPENRLIDRDLSMNAAAEAPDFPFLISERQ
jgi:hypothetical protein